MHSYFISGVTTIFFLEPIPFANILEFVKVNTIYCKFRIIKFTEISVFVSEFDKKQLKFVFFHILYSILQGHLDVCSILLFIYKFMEKYLY